MTIPLVEMDVITLQTPTIFSKNRKFCIYRLAVYDPMSRLRQNREYTKISSLIPYIAR